MVLVSCDVIYEKHGMLTSDERRMCMCLYSLLMTNRKCNDMGSALQCFFASTTCHACADKDVLADHSEWLMFQTEGQMPNVCQWTFGNLAESFRNDSLILVILISFFFGFRSGSPSQIMSCKDSTSLCSHPMWVTNVGNLVNATSSRK
jgi:hypothetical protein